MAISSSTCLLRLADSFVKILLILLCPSQFQSAYVNIALSEIQVRYHGIIIHIITLNMNNCISALCISAQYSYCLVSFSILGEFVTAYHPRFLSLLAFSFDFFSYITSDQWPDKKKFETFQNLSECELYQLMKDLILLLHFHHISE